MNRVTLELKPDMEQKLRDRANSVGQTLEDYLLGVAEREVSNATSPSTNEQEEFPKYISRPHITHAEFVQLLSKLTEGSRLPVLPQDFSRADIYDDHD